MQAPRSTLGKQDPRTHEDAAACPRRARRRSVQVLGGLRRTARGWSTRISTLLDHVDDAFDCRTFWTVTWEALPLESRMVRTWPLNST